MAMFVELTVVAEEKGHYELINMDTVSRVLPRTDGGSCLLFSDSGAFAEAVEVLEDARAIEKKMLETDTVRARYFWSAKGNRR